MSRVSIIAVGSRGDVAPYTGIGVRLRDAGHEVTIAADKEFAGLIGDLGLEFRPLTIEVRRADGQETAQAYTRDGLFSRGGANILKAAKEFIRVTNEDVAGITADESVDMVLLNPLGSAGYHVAQARGIPSLGLYLQPQESTTRFPPVMLGRSLGPLGNRAAWSALRLVEGAYFGNINDIRARYGLPPTTAAAVRKQQAEQRWPVRYGYSPHVLPRPDEWRPGVDVVGYWWPAVPPEWTPPPVIEDFLAAGPPPVFVGFGSANPGDAQRISDIVTTALRQVGRRGVIQAGWADLAGNGDDMLTIGDAPHEWLFPRMAALVHSCGAGVTAAGLRAGTPTVPVPMTGDHPFWARRLTMLGVSPSPVPFKRLTADRLAAALRETLTDPGYRARATEHATAIAAEDGTTAVVEAVDHLLGS
ncbi:MAG TPA: glycosyltransferase [Pseudonocardiaceae bacterium]|jgi:UDP:flavonoid glycosyltransferase YjiC (YdhE family)|nr:glycosyltransferase [Pseudonocardiaceae bacterium]